MGRTLREKRAFWRGRTLTPWLVSLLESAPHLGDRLTAGQQTLTLFI
jgi:hypothetical protein